MSKGFVRWSSRAFLAAGSIQLRWRSGNVAHCARIARGPSRRDLSRGPLVRRPQYGRGQPRGWSTMDARPGRACACFEVGRVLASTIARSRDDVDLVIAGGPFAGETQRPKGADSPDGRPRPSHDQDAHGQLSYNSWMGAQPTVVLLTGSYPHDLMGEGSFLGDLPRLPGVRACLVVRLRRRRAGRTADG
jgi:hypothetical protein